MSGESTITAEDVLSLEPGARQVFDAATSLLPDDVKTRLWLDLEAAHNG